MFEDSDLIPPRITRFEGKTAVLSALPCGEGERAVPSPRDPVGALAAFAQKNYYRELVNRLGREARRLAAELRIDRREIRIFCNSRLPEKRLAQEAGLGSYGKNGLIIIPGKGSLFVLGGLLLPREAALPADAGGKNEPFFLCGGCKLCAEACPTGAIVSPGVIDRARCLQGLASEPGAVSPEMKAKWGIMLYGCDICQRVCPQNAKPPRPAECGIGVLGPGIPLEKILAAGDEAVRKEVLRGTVLDQGWISPYALKRNALIAAVNQSAEEPERFYVPYRGHPEAGLRDAAEWAAKVT